MFTVIYRNAQFWPKDVMHRFLKYDIYNEFNYILLSVISVEYEWTGQ